LSHQPGSNGLVFVKIHEKFHHVIGYDCEKFSMIERLSGKVSIWLIDYLGTVQYDWMIILGKINMNEQDVGKVQYEW